MYCRSLPVLGAVGSKTWQPSTHERGTFGTVLLGLADVIEYGATGCRTHGAVQHGVKGVDSVQALIGFSSPVEYRSGRTAAVGGAAQCKCHIRRSSRLALRRNSCVCTLEEQPHHAHVSRHLGELRWPLTVGIHHLYGSNEWVHTQTWCPLTRVADQFASLQMPHSSRCMERRTPVECLDRRIGTGIQQPSDHICSPCGCRHVQSSVPVFIHRIDGRATPAQLIERSDSSARHDGLMHETQGRVKCVYTRESTEALLKHVFLGISDT